MLKPSHAWKDLGLSCSGALKSYLERVLGDGSVQVKPPKANLLFTDGVTSIVLHRENEFQVEMIVARPNVEIPEHTHDDVETIEVGFSGDLEFFVEGVQTNFFREKTSPDGTSKDFGRFMPVPEAVVHGGRSGKDGAVFLSVQRWLKGPPRHVGQNWSGPTVGIEHGEAIDGN